MNKKRIIHLAENIFTGIKPVSDDLYRGELKISGKPAGIYFMDISGSITPDNFGAYQEKFLAEEYYSQPSNLQWNIYLLLLQDEINPSAQQKIEGNEKYARKYVFTEPQFEDFFKLEKSDALVSFDVVMQWKEMLRKVDLQEVYSKAKYTEAVERFMNNATKKTTITEAYSDKTDVVKINFINQIKLTETFREFPKEPRDFNFGKVNLFKGINGVGKTSLLESIELIACGRTYRNSDKKEMDNCIEAVINQSQKVACTPSDNGKYRARDAYWYSNNYARDNYVYSSFNRFNFFNTDAANDLAKSNSEDEVRRALSNIILGPEFNYLTDRINGFYDRIKPKYNELDREITAANLTIAEANATILRFEKSATTNSLASVISENIKSVHFKNTALSIENHGEIEALINEFRSLFGKILETLETGVFTRQDMATIKKIAAQKEEAFLEFRKKIQESLTEISSVEKNITVVNAQSSLISDAGKYFSDPRLFDIDGFNKRSTDLQNVFNNLQAMLRSLGSLDMQNLSSNETLSGAMEKLRTELNSAKSLYDEKGKELNDFLSRLNNVDRIINEIKLLGKEYLETSPEADACPLCQSTFSRVELENRIEIILKNNAQENQDQIGFIQTAQQMAKANVDRITKRLHDLVQLRVVYEDTFSKKIADEPVDEIIDRILQFKNQEDSYAQQLQQLASFKNLAESFDITEEGFLSLRSKLIKEFGAEFKLRWENKTMFEQKTKTLADSLEIFNKELTVLKEERAKLSVEFKKMMGLEADQTYNLGDFASKLETDKKNIGQVESYFNSILEIVTLREDESISDVDLRMSLLQKNLETYKSEQQTQFELKKAQQDKEQAQTFLEKNRKKFDRLKLAFDTLASLKESDGAEQLNTFFEKNFDELVDIFKTIHAPREFKSLAYSNGQFNLITESGQVRRLSEISTGQRSALALSLFVSLNRQLKNGPNLMIFDDPVSHIDDLNALSFLDFLRLFILKEGRQIFFATANLRLASLFERKFSFLETDFKKWDLQR